MTEEELKVRLQQEIDRAESWLAANVDQDNATCLNYYLRRPFGNEVEGRSQAILPIVEEVVEALMPDMMEIFTGGERIVEVVPRGPEDEEAAEQATDYLHYIMFNDNDGFRVIYEWIKTALLQKASFVTAYWDDSIESTEERYRGLDEAGLAAVTAGQDVEVISLVPAADQSAGPSYDVVIRRTRKTGRVRVESVPPEDFFISPEAVSIETARLVGDVKEVTLSDLRAMGYPEEQVTAAARAVDRLGREALRSARDLQQESIAKQSVDEDTVPLYRCYYRVDYDGDGIAELRHIVLAGGVMLKNEAAEEAPYAALVSIIHPYRFFGVSHAERFLDIQLYASTVLRRLFDQLWQEVYGLYAIEGDNAQAEDDLLYRRAAGIVHVNRLDEIRPLANSAPALLAACQNVLELLRQTAENRGPVTRYNQGMDARSLNKTATGIIRIMDAAQAGKRLLARTFAETGFRRLFKLILSLVTRNQDRARMIRLRNKWVEMDPSSFPEMDVTISVGLAMGDRAQQLVQMSNLIDRQMALVNHPLLNSLVTPENIYESYSKLVRLAGFKNIESFLTKPEPKEEALGAGPSDAAGQAAFLQVLSAQVELARLQLEAEKIALERQRLESQKQAMMAQAALQMAAPMSQEAPAEEVSYGEYTPGA